MKILFESQEIRDLKESRIPEFQNLPEHFQDDSISIDKRKSYTIQKEFVVSAKATFENKENRITVKPMTGSFSRFGYLDESLELKTTNCKKGLHNIQLGEVKIIEHPLAFMSAYNLYLDFNLELSSFPTFDYCDQVYVQNIKNNIIEKEKISFITIEKPFAISWDKGYCIMEPDDGTHVFHIDHQITYPGTSVGNWRVHVNMEPSLFTFLSDARTTAFRPKKEAEEFYQIGLNGGLKDYPFSLENVILVDEEKIYNPRTKYDYKDKNYEFICHELIDIMAWIRFLEEEYKGRFVGKMTTYLFDHHKQIDIATYLCSSQGLAEVGIVRD